MVRGSPREAPVYGLERIFPAVDIGPDLVVTLSALSLFAPGVGDPVLAGGATPNAITRRSQSRPALHGRESRLATDVAVLGHRNTTGGRRMMFYVASGRSSRPVRALFVPSTIGDRFVAASR